MSISRILTRLIVWDMRVQARENIYLFTVLTTLTFCVFIWLLPDRAPDTVVTGVLFLDPAVVGTSFVAAIVLMERSQNTLVALAVSPARPSDYVLSKIITLMLRSLLWAADPSNVSTTEAIYVFGYMGLLIAVFFVWALRLYGDNIARSAT